MCVHTYTNMRAITINEKRDMNLKESREGYIKELERRKGKEEML